MTMILTSVLMIVTSTIGLRLVWRKRSIAAKATMTSCWTLLLVAIYIATIELGLEQGITYALTAFALVGIITVLANVEERPTKRDKVSRKAIEKNSAAQRWGLFFTAGPLAGLACCQASLILTSWLPLAEISRIAIAALTFPILWGIAAYLVCMLNRPYRHLIILVTVTTLSSVTLYI